MDPDKPYPTGKALLRSIVRQRTKVEKLRAKAKTENDVLARMLLAARDDDHPDVNLAAAARAMGVSKQTVNSLLAKLPA
ncbi:MAG: hypothetical protein ABR616_10310 [Dermatophilaceae bacterium]